MEPRWTEPCIVAAPGPSLTGAVIHVVRMTRWLHQWRVIAVQDVYKVLPTADVVYGCDNVWWDVHQKCTGFHGERWASHEQDPNPREIHANDKRDLAKRYDINLVRGRDALGFSQSPDAVHYGHNSGFQAVNLALNFGSPLIVLVGFDMRLVEGKTHYFGDHPAPLRNAKSDDHFKLWIQAFNLAKAPEGRRIVNATPGSALKCYESVDLESFISAELRRANDSLYRDRPESHACAG